MGGGDTIQHITEVHNAMSMILFNFLKMLWQNFYIEDFKEITKEVRLPVC